MHHPTPSRSAVLAAAAGLCLTAAAGAQVITRDGRLIYPQGQPVPRYQTETESNWLRQHPGYSGGTDAVTAPPTGPIHCTAEYEPQEGIIIGWEGGGTLNAIQAETGATTNTVKSMQFFPATARLRRYAKGALEPTTIPLPPAQMPSTALAAGGLIGAQVVRQPVGVVACITPYNFPIVNMAGKVGPNLTHVGTNAADRQPDVSAKDYIRESILDPNAFIAPDCPTGPCTTPSMMPPIFGDKVTAKQLETLVEYLSELK